MQRRVDPTERRYLDRTEAGLVLAHELSGRADLADALVLALPRGGVPVGYEIARKLGLELDVLLVRKLGVPWQPELAMGAVAEGGMRVLSPEVIRGAGLGPDVIQRVTDAEEEKLARRGRAFRGNRPPPQVSGRTVILVDDGMATGATMSAAIKAARHLGAARIVVAVPVAAPEAIASVDSAADETVCPVRTDYLWAIGQWYGNFEQLTDEAVRDTLSLAARERESDASGIES